MNKRPIKDNRKRTTSTCNVYFLFWFDGLLIRSHDIFLCLTFRLFSLCSTTPPPSFVSFSCCFDGPFFMSVETHRDKQNKKLFSDSIPPRSDLLINDIIRWQFDSIIVMNPICRTDWLIDWHVVFNGEKWRHELINNRRMVAVVVTSRQRNDDTILPFIAFHFFLWFGRIAVVIARCCWLWNIKTKPSIQLSTIGTIPSHKHTFTFVMLGTL